MRPGMSGAQTLVEIRKEHLADETPVIALTADAIVGARENYIKEGFTDYLSKPVMYEALEALLHKYLNKDLVMSEEELSKEKASKADAAENKPVVLVINDSKEELSALKEIMDDKFKGVYVRDEASAQKYLDKHNADYVLRKQ
jgi:DNA-binding NtrC family response regulator